MKTTKSLVVFTLLLLFDSVTPLVHADIDVDIDNSSGTATGGSADGNYESCSVLCDNPKTKTESTWD